MNGAASIPGHKIIVIGIGNDFAGDDAAGLLVARELKHIGAPAEIVEAWGEGAALMDIWRGFAAVILIDSLRSGAVAGTIHRFEAHRNTLPAQLFHSSTHAFGLHEAIELARALHRLPPRMIVYGIEGKNFTAGMQVSSALVEAIPELAHSVIRDITHLRQVSA